MLPTVNAVEPDKRLVAACGTANAKSSGRLPALQFRAAEEVDLVPRRGKPKGLNYFLADG